MSAPCKPCHGTGRTGLSGLMPCPHCGGRGVSAGVDESDYGAGAGPYGESIGDARAKWVEAGRCRNCRAPGPHFAMVWDAALGRKVKRRSKQCARCRRRRSSRASGSGRASRASGRTG